VESCDAVAMATSRSTTVGAGPSFPATAGAGASTLRHPIPSAGLPMNDGVCGTVVLHGAQDCHPLLESIACDHRHHNDIEKIQVACERCLFFSHNLQEDYHPPVRRCVYPSAVLTLGIPPSASDSFVQHLACSKTSFIKPGIH
jgi:hypothetical protein